MYHEVLTDILSSTLGMICSLSTSLKEETWWLMEMVLHLNQSIRDYLVVSDGGIEPRARHASYIKRKK